jgi:hypothetical protein
LDNTPPRRFSITGRRRKPGAGALTGTLDAPAGLGKVIHAFSRQYCCVGNRASTLSYIQSQSRFGRRWATIRKGLDRGVIHIEFAH